MGEDEEERPREEHAYDLMSRGGERSPVKPPWGSSGTFFGLQGAQLTRLGAVLLLFGLILFLNLPLGVALGGHPFGPSPSALGISFLISVVSMFLFGIGATALRLGMVRPVSRYVATETAPAMEYEAEALGRGIAEGFQGVGVAPPGSGGLLPTTIKVKCRNCGYLESEDATYYSKCG